MVGPSPQISVLLPVRDAIAFLAEALDSVLAEELPLELIAVDDGSRDGSAEWLDAAAQREPRLRVIHTPPRGIVAALNLALAEARAPLVARLDADDASVPGRLTALHERFARDPALAVCGTGVRPHPGSPYGAGMQRYLAWLDAITEAELGRELWVESPLAHPTLGARRAILVEAGGYAEGDFPEDYELLLRLHGLGRKLGKIAEPWYLWRDHPARLTRTDRRYALDAHRALKARYLGRGPLAGIRRVAMWGAGRSGRAFARALAREGIATVAWIEVDPRKIGRLLHGAPILGIDRLDEVRPCPVLVAVGAEGARPLIRAELARRGFEELRDYWVVA